jgi:hypothetical protein
MTTSRTVTIRMRRLRLSPDREYRMASFKSKAAAMSTGT